MGKDDSIRETYSALISRADLEQFKPNSNAMLALELKYGLDDLRTVADDALTDDKLDRKCDLLYIDRENGLAVIAQAYEADSLDKAQPPANKAADLNTALTWILDGQVPSAELGEKLRAAAQDLRSALAGAEISTLEIWFVHNLPTSPNVDKELRQVEGTAASLVRHHFPDADSPEVRALQVSRDRIVSWYRNQDTAILVSDTLTVPKIGAWFEQAGSDWRAICTSIPAAWLRDLYTQYGDELFSANVRGPIPSRRSSGNINFTIGQTAKSDPDHFWAYNNGITAIVNSINPAEDGLRIEGIAIVNGAQTTGSLPRDKNSKLEGVQILARFVESSNRDVIDGIIRYNNSQNPIKPSDFRSRDRHQQRLRKEFSAIPDVTYLGTRRGGRDDAAKKPSNYISADTAAQSLASFHRDPGTAYHELKQIWDRDDQYATYFGDHTTATHIVFCWSLLRAVQYLKQDYVTREESLTSSDKQVLQFLRKRGATFLLVSAIGSTIDSILGRAVPSSFRLSFSPQVSPAEAVKVWYPVVLALASLAPSLDVDNQSGTAFQRHTNIDERLAGFQQAVAAIRRPLADIFATFAATVVEDATPEAP
ncbi:AIPR family protein [Mobilicoccus caccae]|uniref:Abortive phage infection protein C-terminal domain-containing protein n=1 Tax=Mobilicoccus caccae TaxID=1859295 RepID=A0ABQ6IL39_9MICO|nr:AIPR family protein [Mobilicoccus caccae]GMA38615.1 hypothetical protein GCM10025883_06600 [Mobilicoccus caccae]